ncbi:MAG: tetratricopeptide repeat protein [Verrucomicrobiae bacterium]|nr:tetratricopeptide repeat protein [Verrucomicrobiae bacterium]
MQRDWRPETGLGKVKVIVLTIITCLFVDLGVAQNNPSRFDPSDAWFRAYTLYKEGESAEGQGRMLDALSKYNESKPLFDDLARSYPDFYPELVEYRRTQLVQKVVALKERMRTANQPAIASQAPVTVDPGIATTPPSVQPISPEFAPSTPPANDGSVQLPEWSEQSMAQAPRPGGLGTPAPPTVVRPPSSDPSTLNGGNNYQGQPQAPYWGPQGDSSPPSGDLASTNPFERMQNEYDRLRSQVDSLTKRNQQLESDLNQKQNELFDAQNQLAQSQQRTSDLRKRLDEAEKRASSNPDYEAVVDELKQTLTEAVSLLEKKDQENKELLAQLKSTQSEMDRIKKERDDIERERNNLLAMMEGGGESSAVAQLMDENRELRDKLKEVEKKARELQKDNSDKTVEVALLKEQINQIKSEREKLVEDNRRYEGYVIELRKRLTELGAEVADNELAVAASGSVNAAAENDLLRSVILKQMRRQKQVMQTKSLLLRELDKLGVDAENLYALVEDMASPSKLSEEELGLLKRPEMVEMIEAEGIERVDGVILVEGTESDGSGTGIVETQNLDDELVQIQKAARLDYSEGRFEEAEKAYQKYLDFRPNSVVCLCNLALVKMATREHKDAQKLLEKAIAIKSDFGLAYYLLGRNYYAQNMYDEALDQLNISIQHDPRNARAHNCVGVISSQKGYVNRAEDAFNEAVKIDPKFGDAHYNLAVLYATMDKPDPNRAEEHYQEAITLGVPRDSSIEHYLEAARMATSAVSMR